MNSIKKLFHYSRRISGQAPFFRSMTGRVFLILLIGVVASASLTWWVAFNERQRAINQMRDQRVIERAEQLIYALDAIPAAARQGFLAKANRPGLRAEEVQDDDLPLPMQSELSRALAERLAPSYRVVALQRAPSECTPLMQNMVEERPLANASNEPWRSACESMHITLKDGSLVRLSVLAPHVVSAWRALHLDYTSTVPLFLASMILLAYLVARMTMLPLKRLAQAAKDLGADINRSPLEPHGVAEIRQAAMAFNSMQARIRQHIGQRTQMLAAITHDLQTPLTRLRLRLEKVGDGELRDKLVQDLSAMQAMVKEGLDLARSMDSSEAMQTLDLDSMLDSVCIDAVDAGQAVTLAGQAGMAIKARPTALRRCLVNLIDNAVKYGLRARVEVECIGVSGARIRICDDGPGIPPDQLARVFEPFYRIEGSRSRESGGTGLGLTIARNIIEQHGGTLMLANHRDGGLEVTLVLHKAA